MGRNHRDHSPGRLWPRAGRHSKNVLARRLACRPRRGFARGAAGALPDSPDRAPDRGRGGHRQRTASGHSRRCKRRDGRAGAGLCPHGRGDEGKDVGTGARGRGAASHRGRPRPARRPRKPVQRGGPILRRFDRPANARRHHHRLERGSRTPLRLFGRGSDRTADVDPASAGSPRGGQGLSSADCEG